jgi:hypothetical protein
MGDVWLWQVRWVWWSLAAQIVAVPVAVAERFSGTTHLTEVERHGGDQVMAMSERALIRLAWCTWATVMALLATGVGMLLTVHYRFPGAPAYDYWRETTIIPAVYATLGLIIATRRPRHLVGWLLMGFGVVSSIQLVAGQYGALAGAADLPGRPHALWASSQAQGAVVGLLMLLLLLFPTGRPPSPRWRPVAWSLVAGTCLTLVNQTLRTRTLPDFPGVTNPFGVPALEPILGPLDLLAGVLLIGGVIGAIASLVVRLRRSRGRERQQLKWFVYVALLGIVAIFPLGALLAVLIGQLPHGWGGIFGAVFQPWLLAPIALAVTVAVAIVRHQLYDIDRVINRTLVYVLLTTLLGGIYAGLVLVLGQLSGGLSAEPPSWAVAGATLAVAALFQPARGRIQQAVDRRFNRGKYNAAKTIQVYSVRLRDQLDLDTLSTELLAVVDQTMEPTQVSLWLRPAPHGSPSTPRSEARPNSWAY